MNQLGSFCLLLFFCNISSYSQSQSDIFIFNLDKSSDSLRIYKPRLLTSFNKKGTCKDPHLVNQEKMLLSCKSFGSNQFDIWSLNLQNNYYQQISKTKANESYILTQPNTNNYLFVRSEQDELSPCKLWYYPMDLAHAGNSILTFDHPVKNIIPVSDTELLVLFNITPSQLAFVNIETKKTNIFSSKIGTTIIYKNDLIYSVHKTSPFTWYFKAYDPITRTAKTLFKLPIETEVFAHLKDNQWIFANGSLLYSIDLDTETSWNTVNDLSIYGIQNIEEILIDYERLIVTTTFSN